MGNKYLNDFVYNKKINLKDIEKLVESLNFSLPLDYLEFMLNTNGGEGFIKDSFVRIWKVEELIESNQDYCIDEFIPEIFLFGTNGGPEALAFIKKTGEIVSVPFDDLSFDKIEKIGENFDDLIENYPDSIAGGGN